MLRNCTAARYEINKARMVRLAEYSRDCLRALRARDRHRLRRAHAAARCSCFAPRSSSTAAPPTSPILQRERRRLRAARPRRLHSPRARARARAREVRRRPAAARRRDRRLLQVHAGAWPTLAAGARRRVPLRRRRSARSAAAATASPASTTDSGVARGRRLPGRARQLFAAAARADRHRASPSIRSRATRSRCRSPMPPARPSRR